MTKGTILRIAALAIAVLAAIVCMFDIIVLPLWVKVIIAIALLAACVVCAYFNNDFSEAACKGTGMTRQIKRELKDNYVGERFYTPSGLEMKELPEEVE